jgi:hypothetical protein
MTFTKEQPLNRTSDVLADKPVNRRKYGIEEKRRILMKGIA